ncbi:MAG TPA: sugar phosphate isomerase/epimerase family protein [Candidatus Methylomirabilis sp.]|nr:sugar phosphate isomerase/epimerase family protein [Candidatus Methylomirabilis sp.]
MQLSLLASTPDIAATGYMVNLLLGAPPALAGEARELGYDGIEFFPGPPGTISVAEMSEALRSFDLALTAVNSGRIVAEGLTLLHPEPTIRARAQARLKDLLDFAGHFGAPVTMAGVKGSLPAGAPLGKGEALAEEIFDTLAKFAIDAGSVLLLTPTDEADSNLICTVAEAMAWVQRVNRPGFGMMLDTHQLARKEASVVEGLRAADGLIRHLHLYDPGRRPPGTRKETRLDWPAIMATLRDIDYNGAASVCLAPTGDRRAQAQQTAAYLRSLMAS